MGGLLEISELEEYKSKANSDKKYNIFVETGTFLGNTIIPMSKLFEKCYTIELSELYYNKTLNNAKSQGINNIEFILGDSSQMLKKICEKEKDNQLIFFLDAHYSSGDTAQGEKDVPLFEELSIIKMHMQKDIIIIDDYRLFGKKLNEDWSNINLNGLLDTLEDRVINHYINNDRVIIYLN